MKACKNIDEIKEYLSGLYPYRIELHSHTNPVSGCSEIPPEELVRIYSEKGVHGIVITNHLTPSLLNQDKDGAICRYLSDYEKAKDAATAYGMSVFLGAELRFSENMNDYLLYGVDMEILKTCYDYLSQTVTAFRQEVALPNSVFLQAHPFRNGMMLCDPALLDGMECLNLHPNHNSRIGMATRYAYTQQLSIKTAGTDFHHPNHEALALLRTRQMPKDSFDIARILKSGDYVFELGDRSLWIP